MDVNCTNCGASNRATSRYCARCGQDLPRADEGDAGQEGAGAGQLDLPWLQAVQERGARPPTEQLSGEQIASPTSPDSPDSPATPDIEIVSEGEEGATIRQIPQREIYAPKEPEPQPEPEPIVEVYAPKSRGAGGESSAAASGVDQAAPAWPTEDAPDEQPPDWVVSILEPGGAALNPEQTYEPEELSHIIPWTQEGAPAEAQGQVGTPGLPPWLGDVTVQETLQSSSPNTAEGRSNTPTELGLGDIEPFMPPVPADADAEASIPPEQLPQWLQSLRTTDGDETVAEAPSTERVASRELPPEPVAMPIRSLVRDMPVRAPRPGAAEALTALIGPTAGEPVRRAVSLPGVAGLTVAEARERRRGVRHWLLPDGLIYIAILASLLAVLLIRPPFGDVSAPAAPDVQEFYNAVESVPSDRPVLVVYDWDATRSAEMSDLSEAVMHHLMSRNLHFVTVSTVPQGPGFAQQVTGAIADRYGYVYGRDYLVLGYLPGNESALRALTSNFAGVLPLDYERSNPLGTYDLIQGGQIGGIDDFALIIDLASEEADLRNWIEQVASRTEVPIVAAVPQALEPLARPYKGVPGARLEAVVSGTAGAFQYTRQLELQGRGVAIVEGSVSLTDRLNAQSVAQILVALVILAALVGMGTGRILRR